MFLFSPKKIDFITSLFTRQQGYIDIKSSIKYSHQKAISILNSFTPQGASPQISLRIGQYDGTLGIGYYYMENEERARISTILIKNGLSPDESISVPSDELAIRRIASGDQHHFFKYFALGPMDLLTNFSSDKIAVIIYSLLVGDNMIIVHPNHSVRLQFITELLQILPSIVFDFNRITSSCAELDGNENIVGVAELPEKYRSHKKLYLPLDTIFIDLEQFIVQGEGMKRCSFSNKMSDLLTDHTALVKEEIQTFFQKIVNNNQAKAISDFDEPTKILITKIRMKLGLEEQTKDNWLLTF